MVNRLFVASTVFDAPVRVYTVEKQLSMQQLRNIGRLLIHPVTESFSIQTHTPQKSFSWAYEIGFLPGVTDNVAATVREMIEDGLGIRCNSSDGVYSSQITFVSEAPKPNYNPLIQSCRILSGREYEKRGGFSVVVPKVRIRGTPSVRRVSLTVSDEELVRIGREGIVNPDGTRRGPLTLDLASMKTIQSYFQRLGRNPTDVELESIAQTWSEHCKHTIMNSPIDDVDKGLFTRYIKRATNEITKTKKNFCVSVFSDNSGAIAFNRKFALTYKVETHNSPSALDPFGGAMTGILGVNRDCIGFGLGAKPIANTFGFCVGELDDNRKLYRDEMRTKPLFTPRRILGGVVAGVNSGGNCSGIPTPLGFVCAHDGYRGKPLVFVGTVGLIPKNRVAKRARAGDLIVMVGGRVGLDGIHGATFSSEQLHDGSPMTAVQIGDPITQKKLSDVITREARDINLYKSITDNGAGGLSCSVAEMAKESGGCVVDLEKVPLKYPGLAPWQIWVSESQERMTLALPPYNWKRFSSLCSRRGVEASVIGLFNDSGRCAVRYNEKTVMDLSLDFLHNGKPKTHLRSASLTPRSRVLPRGKQSLATMLSRPSVAGFSWISGQFDHEVQGTSVVKPLQGRGLVNGDAAVIRPLLSLNRGVALTQTICMEKDYGDPYSNVTAGVESAIGKAIACGADPKHIALLDNFCWSHVHDPKRLWQLRRAAAACYDSATAYGTPFISGKDSMFNDFSGFDQGGNPVNISIPPTLLISAIGIIPDVRNSVTIGFKFPGDLIYVLNGAKTMYDALAEAISLKFVASALVVGSSGVGVAVAKSALAGMLGADVSLQEGKVIVSVNPKKRRSFEHVMNHIEHAYIGVVTNRPKLLGMTLEACMDAYRSHET